MSDGMSLRFNGNLIADLDRLSEGLKAKVFRPVAHAGSIVYYDEARRLVPVKTGTLHDSIYRVFAEDLSDATTFVYEVSWNHSKAPHGWLVENGHLYAVMEDGQKVLKQTQPVGFIRRAGDRADEAVKAMEKRAAEKIGELIAQSVTADELADAGERA
ncbi:HK97 gp10 family phage protein [Alcaligenaceae bacterium B3P038]|nr:HK97 gp10 family phage protein [Alcaligenaceae bacterium B3P038]